MNFNIPPTNDLEPFREKKPVPNPQSLHLQWEVRKYFYETVLIPTGHAKRSKGGQWSFSREYKAALINELPFLQALLKMIL